MGSGRYSSLLSYGSWLRFINAQRIHLNYVEGLPTALVNLLISGLFYPRYAVIAGLSYMVGREVYGACVRACVCACVRV